METDPIAVLAARRTPLGAFMGALAQTPATALGTAAIRAALADAGLGGSDVSEVLMGCVLPAGQGQAPARQAARAAGLDDAVGATTINKVCGSGMKAVMLGHDLIRAGSAGIVVAGGMEAMSSAPFLLPEMRRGRKAGSAEVLDHMMNDGLEDAYDRGRPMGAFGEATAERYQFTRADQDAYAIETLERARAAVTSGAFDAETTPITLTTRRGAVEIARDERPEQIDPGRIPTLRSAFGAGGTITAASSSANADGAAALVLAAQSRAEAEGVPVLARILGHATHSQDPAWFTTAPIPAIRKLLDQVGWQAEDVDLYEINEAFAVVAMAAAKDIGIPRDRLNVNGGACALGHPIGATGARILVTLIHALRARGLRRGIACLCIGGGEATAIAVEVPA
ncbi:acetyl-CoA C-acyltransferase [Pseudodonghicola sp. IC7]|uniref:Acetyl-CoA C-acyltransferase n=1 Tax=Pseudodonghicola flavimaris TaxID=3050036 RepID=A0ABT7EVX1_9RHOB|nr:acetyl-CoA C-acyltransferase [Pseudodonghicola flavimaris]MDK3016487.1 acetyl-CoA C-acyltransferase [Pseudodonghicola flavimaris]